MAATAPPADTSATPEAPVVDEMPEETEIVADVPSAKEAPYDASSVSSVKDEISEMFEKIERTQTPEDPTLAPTTEEETFNLRKEPPVDADKVVSTDSSIIARRWGTKRV